MKGSIMNYKTMLVGVLLAGSMQSARAMKPVTAVDVAYQIERRRSFADAQAKATKIRCDKELKRQKQASNNNNEKKIITKDQ
jgi:hypothetical protein